MRRALAELGRKALDDATFAGEVASARAEIDRLSRAADARARDVAVYEAALAAYDRDVWRKGIRVGAALVAAVVAAFIALIVWRVTMTAPPPDLGAPIPESSS